MAVAAVAMAAVVVVAAATAANRTLQTNSEGKAAKSGLPFFHFDISRSTYGIRPAGRRRVEVFCPFADSDIIR